MADGKGSRRTISVKTFQCQGCGAIFLLAPGELSTTCAFCGSVHVLALDQDRDVVEPDVLIPMAVDQIKAAELLEQWFIENQISPQPDCHTVRGLYQPVWGFDLIGSLPWNGRVVRNKHEEPVSGECPALVSDICIPGSPKLGSLFLEMLPEYNLAAAASYDPRVSWLAGPPMSTRRPWPMPPWKPGAFVLKNYVERSPRSMAQ